MRNASSSFPNPLQYPFSYANGSRPAGDPWRPPHRQVHCHATRTTAETEALVAASPSAVYEGAGGLGVGPRYCPSLEAKAREKPHDDMFLSPLLLTGCVQQCAFSLVSRALVSVAAGEAVSRAHAHRVAGAGGPHDRRCVSERCAWSGG